VRGPVVIHPDFRAAVTSAISRSVMEGRLKGIFMDRSAVAVNF